MNSYAETSYRRFYRNSDKAILGGVCAGLAEYFGFNLRVTRLLVFIAFCMAMPMAIFTYLAVVFLVPASSSRPAEKIDPEFRQALRSSPTQTVTNVRRHYQSLDRRLAKLEKYVTSSRYNLDKEFRNL